MNEYYVINEEAVTSSGLPLPSGWVLSVKSSFRQDDKYTLLFEICKKENTSPISDTWDKIPKNKKYWDYNNEIDNVKSENLMLSNTIETFITDEGFSFTKKYNQ